MGSGEIALIGIVTWIVIAYCAVDLARHRERRGNVALWAALLGAGVIVWPIAWISAAVYLRLRDKTTGESA